MFKIKIFLFVSMAAVAVWSCAHGPVVTTWKATNTRHVKFNKILVAGIIQDTDLALSRQMEQEFVTELKSMGYNAVSKIDEFGPHGLANLQQEQTYQKLCSQGIDAVLTIALLDKKKEQQYVPARVKYYSSLYYYNRIWDYKKIKADLVNKPDSNAKNTRYLWECILFDLSTLQPLYTSQSRPFDAAVAATEAPAYAKKMITLLLKNKMLAKPEQVKAF